jgi:dolichyl-phosphate beta-glucosyltransferase
MVSSFSLIVPMFNEASRMERSMRPMLSFVDQHHLRGEVVLVDDGSTDQTLDRARELLQTLENSSGRVIGLGVNRGKGAAVREGMMNATGDVRIFADADNATPIEELDRLLPMVSSPRHIVIGSRSIDRSLLEVRQPWWRERMGKTFNLILRSLVGLPFHDTQCGFKLFGDEAAKICFSRQRLDGFAFDVELLWIARSQGLEVTEAAVRWRHVDESRVDPFKDSLRMLRDALKVRWLHRND